jgi:hypothetical protein
MSTPQTQPTSIVARHDNVEALHRIDSAVSVHLEGMVRSAKSIRNLAAQIVVAGVQMIEIMNSDLAAWDEFVEPFQINVKGDDRSYREIAHVLFRDFTTEVQGDGSLVRRTISRDRVCRYAAAIFVAHRWFREGCSNPAELTKRIVKNGGVWALAKLRAEQREMDRLTSTEEAIESAPTPLTLKIKKPLKPVLILVFPDGSHHPVPPELAGPVIERMVH